jgi:hypothetical protein
MRVVLGDDTGRRIGWIVVQRRMEVGGGFPAAVEVMTQSMYWPYRFGSVWAIFSVPAPMAAVSG